MKVLVAGASGLIGRALLERFATDEYDPVRLVRHSKGSSSNDVSWDPSVGLLDGSAFEGVDAAVCLSGENIGSGRWTARKKHAILESRVASVGLLSRTLAGMARKPKTFVCASAIGYYGDGGDGILTERSPKGEGFLAEVCEAWEGAAQPAIDAGIRVVFLRFGPVLSTKGGALAKMLLPFRLGLGGRVGDGTQYFSWVTLEDAVRIVEFSIRREELRGPVNAVAPGACTNAEFTRALGDALRRPVFVPLPAILVRLLFGEMGESLLLSSARVAPRALVDAGFEFEHGALGPALDSVLGK